LPDSPQQLVKLHLSVPVIRDKLFAGIELHYMSARPTFHNTTDGFGQPLTVQGLEADDFTVVNFTLLSRELIKNLEASVSLYNALDRRYGDPATRFHRQDVIEQDGRSFRVKLVYRF